MALTYRTPMEDIVASFEPAVQASIASKAALEYKLLEEKNFTIANYHMRAEAKQKLSSAGIYLSPYSAIVHSHPVCKTLENHILYVVLPNYINNKFFFVGIKNSKVNLLKSRNSNLDLISVVNRYVTSADKARYSNDFVVRSSNEVRGLSRHRPSLAGSTLKDLVPNLNPIKSKHLFLHDELHYWDHRDLITFLEVLKPEIMLGTIVYPPELLIGAKASLNPWCYQFEVKGNSLLFYPDGERSEGYEQPLNCGYLLTANEIVLPNGDVYCVDIICSKFAHHLVSISRGSSLVNRFRSFGRFEAVSFSGLLNLSPLNQPYIPVPYEVVSKLYRYLRSLKKPDAQSAMAKLSQIVPEPTAEEIKFTQEFADLVMHSDPVSSLLSVNRLQTFFTRAYMRVLPKWIYDRIKSVKALSLDDFIRELKPYSFNVTLKSVAWEFSYDLFEASEFEIEECPDLIENLDKGFSEGVESLSLSRRLSKLSPSPYAGTVPLVDRKPKRVLMIDQFQMLRGLAKILISSFDFNTLELISVTRVSELIKSVAINSSLIFPIKCVLDNSQFNAEVCARIRAIMVSRFKLDFKGNLAWFMERRARRVQTAYLTNYEEKPTLTLPYRLIWASVIENICHDVVDDCQEEALTFERGNLSDVSIDEQNPDCHNLEGLINRFGLKDLDPKLVLDYLESINEKSESEVGTIVSTTKQDSESSDSLVKLNDPKSQNPRLVKSSAFRILNEYNNLRDFLMNKLGLQASSIDEVLCRHGLQEEVDCVTKDNTIVLSTFLRNSYHLDVKFLLPEPGEGENDFLYCSCSDVQEANRLETVFIITNEDCSITEVVPKNLCVIQAIAQALSRTSGEIINVLNHPNYDDIFTEVLKGEGLGSHYLEEVFRIFDIKALLETDSGSFILNEEGSCVGCFRFEGDHLSYLSSSIKSVGVAGFSGHKGSTEFNKSTNFKLTGLGSTLTFKAKESRANLLADCLHSGNTGVLMSEIFNKEKHLLKEQLSKGPMIKELEVRAILGTFGVGKSSLFKGLVAKARGCQFDFVSPRRALMEEIKIDLNVGATQKERKLRGQQNWYFSTFERFLQRVSLLREDQFVFIDEIQLYPNGYLDLIIYLLKVKVNLVVFGDPCQSDYDSERDRSILNNITSNLDALLKGKSYKYNILSFRFSNPNFEGRLPCAFAQSRFNMGEKEPYLIYNDLEQLSHIPVEFGRVILVSSFEEKKIVTSYYPEAKQILTFGESTGLNFQRGTILITMISERTSEKRWLTALSRFKVNLALVNATGYSIEGLNVTYQGRFLSKFLTGNASIDDLKSYLPGDPEFIEGFPNKVGKDEGIREEKLQGDPWLKCMVDLFQIEDMEVESVNDIMQQVESFKIHLPREELEGTRARWVHKILNKEFREVRMGCLISDQFTDDHSKQKGAAQLTNAAERFEAIYPRHRASDTVTFIMAVKKRLRFSKPHKEKAKLSSALPFGRYLLSEFLKKVPLRKNRDSVLMEKANQEFFDKKTSKSAATIENHNIRSCRDWLADIVQVFSKSQICTKFDNRFRSAKAAQSIACFQHSVLCRFAPYMRYIEKKLHEALPSRFYIHSGKSLEQLNDWVIKSDFSGLCTESDYEAFDASQDQFIVAFEIELMKYLGLPNDLIQDYIYIKTHLGSKLGDFAIMRFTGEASTFLFNTMANMLFTFLRYNLKGNENICFAGDDMCSSKKLTISREHEGFLGKIKLKAKVQHTIKPTFCGWHLSPDGIYKKPQLVFERMCIAKETNNLQNCIDSYAIEVSYAYRLGERVMARMDEEEIGAYYGCVRTIIKYKHLLKSDVKALFESLD
nr:RNA-dependent RNA polymerase [Cowpea mild mottle virus]